MMTITAEVEGEPVTFSFDCDALDLEWALVDGREVIVTIPDTEYRFGLSLDPDGTYRVRQIKESDE